MGMDKDRRIAAEEGFRAKAAQEGWRCSHCNSVIYLDEKDVYFKTRMCGFCADMMEDDD